MSFTSAALVGMAVGAVNSWSETDRSNSNGGAESCGGSPYQPLLTGWTSMALGPGGASGQLSLPSSAVAGDVVSSVLGLLVE